MSNKIKKEKIKELGQFYTNPDIALQCFLFMKKELKKLFNKEETLFIEPSAGTGSFIKAVKTEGYKIIGYDIEPKEESVIKSDFLLDDLDIEKDKERNIIIGNPPFGKRSKLAIDFFNKATEYSNVIGFILPNQFKKYSVQSKLNKDFLLVKEVDLDKDAFYTELDKKYNVNCVFQIWIHKSIKLNKKNLRILQKPAITHPDFEMYQYNNTKQALKVFDNDFDFGVFSQGYGDYNLRVTNKSDFNTKKQRLLFKAKDENVKEKLFNIDFEKLSKDNTTIPGFRKGDVVKEYNNL